MISNKIKKLIGCSLIGIALPLFIPYFGMAYRATFPNPTFSLELSLYTTRLFFTDTGFSLFHYPAFILIGLGLYCLIKKPFIKKPN